MLDLIQIYNLKLLQLKTVTQNVPALIHRLSFYSDEKALDELFQIYYDKLFTSSYVIVKSKDLAEEVVADVFYKIWQNREKLQEIKSLDNYLFVSVKNQSLNYVEKENRMGKDSIDEVLNNQLKDDYTAEDLMVSLEMQYKIAKAIESLPPKCKEIFKLIRFEGLKYKEAAEKLNLSLNTVDAQMGIAMKKLSQLLNYQPRKKKNKFFSIFF